HRRIVAVDLHPRFDLGLGLYWRNRKSSVAHLAALVCIRIGFLGLTFHRHTIFERLQHTTWPTHDLLVLFQPAGDLDVGFTRDTGGDLDESHLVAFDHVNALL